MYFKVYFGNDSSSDSTFMLVFLSIAFFYVATTHVDTWSTCLTIQNNGI